MLSKKPFYSALLLLFTTGAGFSAITVIDSASGTITGTTTTYTVTSSNSININSNGIRTDDDNTIKLMFTNPVDLIIAPHLNNTSAVFSNQNANNTFSGDAGSWSFTAGAQTASYNPNPWYVFTGSLLTTNRIRNGGGHGSGSPEANEDWGIFTISGVKTLTWNVPAGSNREAFHFSADTTTVPEPSGTVLLSFGFLLLMARRKR